MKYFTQKKTILMILTVGILMFCYIGKVSAADYWLKCVYDVDRSNDAYGDRIAVTQDKKGKWAVDAKKTKVNGIRNVIAEYSGNGCPKKIGVKMEANIKEGETSGDLVYDVYLLKEADAKNYICSKNDIGNECRKMTYTLNKKESDETNKTEESGNPREDTETTDFPSGNCGILGPKTIKILKEAINLVRYIVPIIIILLGSLDFAKILFSGEEKVFRDAAGTFAKRLLIGVVFMFIPSIIELLVNLSGLLLDYDIDEVFCGLF